MNQFRTLLAVLAVMTLWAQNAYAYLDPASGSLFLQAIVAAIAGAALVIRTYWHRCKVFFSRLFSRSAETPGPSDSIS